MRKKSIGVKRLLRIMIVACCFIAFARGQVFAADDWPEGVQDNGIPALILTIDEEEFQNVIESGDHSYSAETGSIKIYVPEGCTSEYTGGELVDSKDLSLDYIRGRGHSSWWHEKKPFKIKLDKSQNLLGMGTNKHWVLLANAFDNSLIKNRLVGYMGRALKMDYTPKYVPVDFYVNNQYYGSYLLAQQVRIHETRVNIAELTPEDNEEPEVTGGYLLSMKPYTDGPDMIKTSQGVEFQTEEPSVAPGETGTAAQHDYISNYLQETEDAIFSDTDPNDEVSACAEYMDLRSAARYWWVQEFTRNFDAFKTTSTYLYKDRNSKLYWGPLWDFDFSCSGSASGFTSKMEWLDWMRYFDHSYQQELLSGWEDYSAILEGITAENGMLDQYAAEIEQSWKADYLRWNPDVDPEDPAAVDEAFAKAVSNLRNFLDARRAWFNSNLDILYGEYYSVVFRGEGKEDVIKYYKGGTDIDPAGMLKNEFQRDGYVFLGWMDESGKPLDSMIELTENRIFTAKYISEEDANLPNGLYFPMQEKWCSLEDKYFYLGGEYTITPEKVDDDTICWTCSDESVASLDDNLITLNKAGTVVITGTTRSGVKKSFTLHIVSGDVDGNIKDFDFAEENMTLKPGEFGQNVITVAPADEPVDTSMDYTSSDDDVAEVNWMGVVEAKAEGICTITAKDYWSDIEKSYTVLVSKDGLLPDYTNKTVVLQSNDVHGAMAEYQYMAGLRDELERRHADVIIVDSGDYCQGSKEVSATKGGNAIRMMNKVGYDLATLGNHEFDCTYTNLMELLGAATFEVVCDNIRTPSGKDVFARTKLIDGDVDVGFVGIATPQTQTKTSPSRLEGLTFLDNKSDPTIFEQAGEDIASLKTDGADVVLCLSHLGVNNTDAPYRSYDLWDAVKDKSIDESLDYILDGHSHTVMTEGEHGEPILSTGTKFKNIGVVTIDETTKTLDEVAKPMLYEINKDSYSNEEVRVEADTIAEEIDKIYGVQVGISEVDLNGATDAKSAAASGSPFPNGNRDGETNMGNFATDAFRWYALKDGQTYDVPEDHIIGLYNGGAMRAGISKGKVTRGDVLDVIPFANSIDGIYVTGAQLLEALEASTCSYPGANGGFPHVSGMEYTINTASAFEPAGETYPSSTFYPPAKIKRITINNVNGKPFSLTDKYLVITSSFIVDGGDTYGAFQGAPRIDICHLDEELFCTYISEGLSGVIDARYAEPKGRIHVVNKSEGISIEGAKVVLSAVSFKYNGKVHRPSIKTIKGLKLKSGTDYTVKWSNKNSRNAGKYTVTVTGKGDYTGTAKATYKINKAANTLKVKGKTVKIKYKKLKKQKIVLKASKVIKVKKKGQGKKTYELSSAEKGNKNFDVNKNTGAITVVKKLKKGTYTLKVKVRAAGNANYKPSAWKAVTIKIKVK